MKLTKIILQQLRNLLSIYKTSIESITPKTDYENNPFIANKKLEFQNLYNGALEILKAIIKEQ